MFDEHGEREVVSSAPNSIKIDCPERSLVEEPIGKDIIWTSSSSGSLPLKTNLFKEEFECQLQPFDKQPPADPRRRVRQIRS